LKGKCKLLFVEVADRIHFVLGGDDDDGSHEGFHGGLECVWFHV